MTTQKFNISLEHLDLLVVEDDATAALAISSLLTMYGARVETAVDGNDGLLKFQKYYYPIVITDINMPGLNGIELVSKIKEIAPNNHERANHCSSFRASVCLYVRIYCRRCKRSF